eukprot:308587-Rhodomonas_salina.1
MSGTDLWAALWYYYLPCPVLTYGCGLTGGRPATEPRVAAELTLAARYRACARACAEEKSMLSIS